MTTGDIALLIIVLFGLFTLWNFIYDTIYTLGFDSGKDNGFSEGYLHGKSAREYFQKQTNKGRKK